MRPAPAARPRITARIARYTTTPSNPYSAVTGLGYPITPLPGALLLSATFVAMFHNAAYQNALCLLLFLWLMLRVARTESLALIAFVLSFFRRMCSIKSCMVKICWRTASIAH